MLDATSSEWLCSFAYNSSIEELSSQVNNVYSTFDEEVSQGGIMIVKIILNHMFFMSNDVVIELKTFLEKFANNGLATIQCENVVFSIKHILTVCGRLIEVQKIPTETLTHVRSELNSYQWINPNKCLDYC